MEVISGPHLLRLDLGAQVAVQLRRTIASLDNPQRQLYDRLYLLKLIINFRAWCTSAVFKDLRTILNGAQQCGSTASPTTLNFQQFFIILYTHCFKYL